MIYLEKEEVILAVLRGRRKRKREKDALVPSPPPFSVVLEYQKRFTFVNKYIIIIGMKYKAIFCDFDGTIYTEDHRISQVNKDTIAQYVKKGGKFIVSTGRLFSAIYPKLVEMNLDGDVIVYQGAGVYDIKTKTQIFGQYFKREQAVKALEYVESLGDEYVPIVYIDDICHCREFNDYVKEFVTICNIGYKETNIPLSQYVKQSEHLPVKVLVLMDSKYCDAFSEEGIRRFPDLAFMRSHSFIVEIMTKGIDKGLAVKWLCDKYGINTEDTISLGDSENDIAMIKTAGLGVAMANAMPKVKEVADYIADSNDNDGVAKVIQKFCLGDNENE